MSVYTCITSERLFSRGQTSQKMIWQFRNWTVSKIWSASPRFHPRHQSSYSHTMIGGSNHLLIVFRFHSHSQKVIGSLGHGQWVGWCVLQWLRTKVINDAFVMPLTWLGSCMVPWAAKPHGWAIVPIGSHWVKLSRIMRYSYDIPLAKFKIP